MPKYDITYKANTDETAGPKEVEADTARLESGWWNFYDADLNLIASVRETNVLNVQRQ